ncbi:hypothetical protein Q5424_04985 [Conexibacter sp. JD483]|uniref:hypothetical protein n=1 Tax=unclassified Conexibacter TaxID=2627773 RepID=UPI0027213AEE|nr:MULTISPECIES: hypothetical protein [unclassified Conexibacter]MDO8184688.1 hypothetical protein [Conexibacter sp. CPCC 205706]MDO8197994.1 hypothetical protein [Conexibacter sp. CPCC 205762]MDR9368424.1 hypothetical protein [Conexibacter sp. JD483]
MTAFVVLLLAAVPASAAGGRRRGPVATDAHGGGIHYGRHRPPFWLYTTADRHLVNVEPGYFVGAGNGPCGPIAGPFWTSTVISDQWLRLDRRGAFSGRGDGWMKASDDGAYGRWTWTVRGRFTNINSGAAHGRITITAGLYDGRSTSSPIFRCKPITTTWETHRTERV